MQPTTVTWRGLTVATGVEADYRLTALSGWESLPDVRFDKTNRARGHGSHPSPVWADERTVTVEGRCWSEDNRDALLHELKRHMTFAAAPEPLTVTVAGRTLTAGAQLLRCDPSLVSQQWGMGRFGWVAQWRCPDPLRYADPQSAATGLPTSGGGLTYPLTYPLEYGALGATGQIVLSNPGTADAPITFTVSGPLPMGFELSAGQDRLRYPVEMPAGQLLTINTGTGTVLVEGTADRRANLTLADWMQVPAGGSLTVQFTSLGGAYDDAAQLAATWSSAWW